MFTGIIEHVGECQELKAVPAGARLSLRCALDKPQLGESIALDGVCLTLAAYKDGLLEFDLSHETLSRSTLGTLKAGSLVNVERALRMGDALGGHLVSGHVDAVGRLESSQGEEFAFQAPGEVMALIASKGSVAVNGVSLTPVKVGAGRFSVALIPHTLKATNLGGLKAGDAVNLEVDLIARYVARALEARA